MDEMTLYQQRAMQLRRTEASVEKVNRRVTGHGLVLKPEEIRGLAKRHTEVLQGTGRVEFGEGMLPGLVFAFCDSPYIAPGNFAATIDALMACFYHFKNETRERMPDDALLDFMKSHFDGECHGSVEYLEGTLLERLADSLRRGGPVPGEGGAEAATTADLGDAWEGDDLAD